MKYWQILKTQTIVMSMATIIVGCAHEITLEPDDIENASPQNDRQYINLLDTNDIVTIGSRIDSHDVAKIYLSTSGSDVLQLIENCHAETGFFCVQFGAYFKMYLPCSEQAMLPEWRIDDWSYSVEAEVAGASPLGVSYLIEAQGPTTPTRFVYSYSTGILMFFYIQSENFDFPEGDMAVTKTNGVYVARDTPFRASRAFCKAK